MSLRGRGGFLPDGVGDVDVLVDHDGDAAEVGTHPGHGRDVAGLTRVPRIALLDRDHVEEPAAPDAEAMRVDDPRDAGGLRLAEQQRATEILAIAMRLVRWLVGRDAKQDRVVAVIDRLDL